MITVLFMALFSANVGATPAEVLIIRHGEKPEVGNHLNEAGVARAKALPTLFTSDNRFHKPDAIYAMLPSHGDSSQREIETITPLAQVLHIQPIVEFKRKQTDELAQAILNNPAYDGKTILICWEHKVIPDIAEALGVSQPPGWPHGAFDRVWQITFNADGQVTLADLPEKLMPGDSD